MRPSILKEFGVHQPRAIILDDNANARTMTARRFRANGFEAIECKTVDEFWTAWKPGTVDVIVADWDLSSDAREHGDKVLEKVRKRDWDVPFVLVSGKLEQHARRSPVLEILLESGGARFVKRGTDGIREACESAEDLIERRDLALLKIVLSLREGALRDATIQTSSGETPVQNLLENVVSKPNASHDAGRPIAKNRSERAGGQIQEPD